jgi:hypothetical protein
MESVYAELVVGKGDQRYETGWSGNRWHDEPVQRIEHLASEKLAERS